MEALGPGSCWLPGSMEVLITRQAPFHSQKNMVPLSTSFSLTTNQTLLVSSSLLLSHPPLPVRAHTCRRHRPTPAHVHILGAHAQVWTNHCSPGGAPVRPLLTRRRHARPASLILTWRGGRGGPRVTLNPLTLTFAFFDVALN